MTENMEQLFESAREKFELTSTQGTVLETLCRAFANGEVADYNSDDEELNDPARAQQWGDERTLQADWIFWLCTDPKAAALARPKGLRVLGAKVEGQLDLESATVDFPLSFTRCFFAENFILCEAEIRGLHLVGTHVAGINAEGVKVKGRVMPGDGFKAEDEVCLVDATIGGRFDCGRGHFVNPYGVALNADRMNVRGSVFLRYGFRAEGRSAPTQRDNWGQLQLH